MTATTRQPHAMLDLPSRRLKGLKIERLLRLAECRQSIRMLEIGAGSGGIARVHDLSASCPMRLLCISVASSRR